MGYIYDNIKKALGGNKMNSRSSVINDWTPNGVRTLVITREMVFVGYHVQQPKEYFLDMQEVQMDLQHSNGGAVHNLLSQRQLSCMEEIYIDGMFQNYRGLFDLEGYISKLVNGQSRLRYWGYIDPSGSDIRYLQSVYSNMVINPNYLYSLALDRNRPMKLMYQEVGNREWYKNYNLRPQYYKLDGDKGRLAVYLRKGEDIIKDALNQVERVSKLNSLKDIVRAGLEIDAANVGVYNVFMSLYKYLQKRVSSGSKDEVHQKVYSAIRKRHMFMKGVISGFREDLIEPVNNKEVLAVKLYHKYGLFDTKDSEVNEDKLREYAESGLGFLELGAVLDGVCIDLCSRPNKELQMLLQLNFLINKDSIPDGLFYRKMSKVPANGKATVSGYLQFLADVVGVSLDKVVNSKGDME